MPRQHNPSRARTVAGSAQEGPRPDVPGEAHEALPKRRTRAKKAPSTPSLVDAVQEAPAALPDPRNVGWWEFIQAWGDANEDRFDSCRASIATLEPLRHRIFNFVDEAAELADWISFASATDLTSREGLQAAQILHGFGLSEESGPLGAFFQHITKRIAELKCRQDEEAYYAGMPGVKP